MLNNIILKTDSYKVSHYKQYPPGTKYIHSYLEARKSSVKFFGLRYILKKHFEGVQVTKEKIDQAEKLFLSHLGPEVFNRNGWERLLKKHNGFLPVRIKAVDEFQEYKQGEVLLTIENTDPEFFWLTNYLETVLLQVWYPTTVATESAWIKKTIFEYLLETGDPNEIDFKLHDFGYRGVSSCESAAIGSAAHLINFKGTDTIAGIELLNEYYGMDLSNIGFSIPASEHSTITSWGAENEAMAMENMLDKYPTGLVACVSDSFDIYAACKDIWGTQLKDKIMNRNGTLVIRPDSGEPVEVLSHMLMILEDKFGAEKNEKGFKVLPPQVRLIWGDGVDHDGIYRILRNLKKDGWSASNIAFGMGGALLQKLNRDIYSFAIKCSAIDKGNGWEPVYKNPITDAGKVSKKGYQDSKELKTVFEDGRLKG